MIDPSLHVDEAGAALAFYTFQEQPSLALLGRQPHPPGDYYLKVRWFV